jgi:hypothetical protein
LVHFPDTGEGKTFHTAAERTEVRRELLKNKFKPAIHSGSEYNKIENEYIF